MVLRIQKNTPNRIFKVYWLAMFALMIARYLLKVNVPAAAFLLVAMLPAFFGTPSEQVSFAVSCIPLSPAFQYKYALLILSVAMLYKNKWKLKEPRGFMLVVLMMIWELWHAFYGRFSYVEYLRDFAELILLAVVMAGNWDELDDKLIIRGLTVTVVGVCAIMLIMQLQQFGFNLVAVFARSARSFRFGQSNMADGRFALNFNANNLGYICNLATCGSLLLIIRKEHRILDIVLAVCSLVFAMLTLSRSATVCAIMILGVFLVSTEGRFQKKIWNGIGGLVIVMLAVMLIRILIPTVFENLGERFSRADLWNGRGGLFEGYTQFLFSSPMYFLFGIGMQQIYEKVAPYVPVSNVPHLGFQEVWVAWGVVGVVMMVGLILGIIILSKKYADEKRQLYQFMPLMLVIVFTMSGQLLTSSRALMGFTFAYICLCMKKATSCGERNAEVL